MERKVGYKIILNNHPDQTTRSQSVTNTVGDDLWSQIGTFYLAVGNSNYLKRCLDATLR